MSHFVVGVILPKRKRTYDRKAVNTAVESLMAPFDENEVVEAYEESCYCVGKGASKEWLALNPPEVVKARVAALLLGAGFNPETFDYYASTDKETRKKFDAIHDDIEAERKRFIAAHPDGQAADPECEECNGTGDRETTYPKDCYITKVCPGVGYTPSHDQGNCSNQPSGDEVLRSVRGDKTADGIQRSEDESGREVHVLPTLPQSKERHKNS